MKKYGEKGGITKEHLKQAVEYVFNQPKPKPERRIKFKVFFENEEEAKKWYENFWLPLFKGEVEKQLQEYSSMVEQQPDTLQIPGSSPGIPTIIKIPGWGTFEIEE